MHAPSELSGWQLSCQGGAWKFHVENRNWHEGSSIEGSRRNSWTNRPPAGTRDVFSFAHSCSAALYSRLPSFSTKVAGGMRQHVAATGQPRTIYLALVLGAALLTSHAYAQTTYSAVAPLAAQAPAAEEAPAAAAAGAAAGTSRCAQEKAEPARACRALHDVYQQPVAVQDGRAAAAHGSGVC